MCSGILRRWFFRKESNTLHSTFLPFTPALGLAIAAPPFGPCRHLIVSARRKGHEPRLRPIHHRPDLFARQPAFRRRQREGGNRHGNGKIIALQYSADGRFLAAASTDGGMAIWDSTGKQILAYRVEDSTEVTACTFSPTLDTAFIGHFNGTLTIWDLRRQQEIRSFKANRFQVNALCFSPKNARLYTAGSDGNLVTWSLQGDSLMDFHISGTEILACDLSPDGNLMLIGGKAQTLCLWDLSEDVVFHIGGHRYDVFDVHFSPDGKYMLSTSGGSVDYNARLWTKDRKLVRKLGGHQHDIKVSCFSPDGSRILTGDGNGNVKMWKGI